FLLCCLAGCTTVSPRLRIDPALTAPCAHPVLHGDTYRALASLAVRQDSALRECGSRMGAIRKIGE
ncbi:MAG: Rz1-like lysis system protein LysC, partial [Vulcanimicrobiaceae bacterium]